MQPRELLGVLVRAGGLVRVLLSAFDFVHVGEKVAGIPWASSYLPFNRVILAGVVYVALGLAIIWFAEAIVRFAYGRQQNGASGAGEVEGCVSSVYPVV